MRRSAPLHYLSSPTLTLLLLLLLLLNMQGSLVWGCNKETKEVGVCLHVYLERDFLTMERIVYPRRTEERREMLYNSYVGELRQLAPLPDLPPLTTQPPTTYNQTQSRQKREGATLTVKKGGREDRRTVEERENTIHGKRTGRLHERDEKRRNEITERNIGENGNERTHENIDEEKEARLDEDREGKAIEMREERIHRSGYERMNEERQAGLNDNRERNYTEAKLGEDRENKYNAAKLNKDTEGQIKEARDEETTSERRNMIQGEIERRIRSALEETWGQQEIIEGGLRRTIRNVRDAPEKYTLVDSYGHHGWVEGPELEDYCSRLGSVITCFEEVLVDCDNGFDFFRYRHLLHSLARVHHYLCNSAHYRATRFLPFLKVIDCAENARLSKTTCQRPNITVNVWNQILRLEIGPEVCDSLNTQRSCLLENGYVNKECGGHEKEELYRNVSAVFLATWCKLPLHPHIILSSAAPSSHHIPHSATLLSLIVLFLLRVVC